MKWQCTICGIEVSQTKGPIGMYCRTHKHWRHHQCTTCGTAFIGHKDRKYCQPSCIPKPEKQAPRTDLTWRKCSWCGRWMCDPRRKYCSILCSKENAALMAGRRARSCARCKKPLGWFSTKTLCEPCRAANLLQRRQRDRKNPNRRAQNNHRKRARMYGVKYEPVKRSAVFERDQWKCGICRKHVDRKLTFPHPMSASLDHVVPMALGGEHTYLNTQLAHFICNSKKSHHGTGDQLALIG